MLGANLHGLHAGFGFRTGLENTVIDHGRCRRRWLLVDDGALLRGGVSHDVKLSRLRISTGGREPDDDGPGKQKLLHVLLQKV
jgi:hypothetical protein